MSTKRIRREITFTEVTGVVVEGGEVKETTVKVIGDYDLQKAQAIVRMEKDMSFSATGVSTETHVYQMSLDEFIEKAEIADPII